MTKRLLLLKLPEPARPTQKPTYMPPFGLWSIEHNVRTRGWDVQTLDLHLHGMEALDQAMGMGWDTVGISAQFSIQHDLYVEVARKAAASGARVIAGGFHAAAVPMPAGVDQVFGGCGEQALVPDLGFSDIEYPPVSVERMEPYWAMGAPHDLQSLTGKWMPVEFSRGCNRHCGFCGVNGYWGGVRYFDVVSNLTYLNDLADNGIKEIFIEDDNVISNPGLFSWILDRLRDNGISWSTPNGISARDLVKFVPRLRQSGCWRVSLPFETGNASTARLMRLGAKWMPFDGALSLVDALKAEGIKTCGFFIIGYPGETLDDMRKTLDYANTLPLDQRNIYIATPYPGTPLYEDCKREGWLVSDDYKDLLYTKGLIQTPEFTPGQVEALKARDREAAIARRGKK
jgi:radical SAM superfamily enzyme YgiQ (UPF0313 family)